MKLVPDGLTYTQRTLWFRNNYPLLDMERETISNCSNYRQLMMSRLVDKRASERGPEWLGDLEDMTRTERKLFYRRNEDLVDREREVVDICTNWQQLRMARKTWAQEVSRNRQSENSYGLRHKEEEMSSKNELWLKQADRRISMSREDKAIRDSHSCWENRDALAHITYDIHRMPWDWCELESAASSSAARMMRQDALQAELNELTTRMMTSVDSITKYSLSAHEMALKARMEDEQAVAASRKVTRKIVTSASEASKSCASQQSSSMQQAEAKSAMMQASSYQAY